MLELHDPLEAARWLRERVTGELRTDSRKIGAGDGFVAWPGAVTDGRLHVGQSMAHGAVACLVEREGLEAFDFAGLPVAALRHLKPATGPVASAYYEEPTAHLKVVAVTGTNGKTSTAWWLAQVLSATLGAPCGVVGTLGIGQPPHVVPTGLTTPDPVLMQQNFRRFADQGFAACAIEASSIGIAERRLDGTRVHAAVFTNFTQDHLDYHGSMEAYWEAKAELFRWPGLKAAVVNIDDMQGAALAAALEGGTADLWTFSCAGEARITASGIGYAASGLTFQVAEGTERHELRTRLIGDYNVSNLLGVIATARSMGVPLEAAVRACGSLISVPGRMDCLGGEGQPFVAVDYAHTPDALDKALAALRPLAGERGGKLWCVFGCGGDRDATKRPLMAAVAQKGADCIVVTSDNPRSEKPETIISQVLLGLAPGDTVQVEPDRARAIANALAQAAAGDVVLIAGKGHEDYQEVAGMRHAFSDKAQAQAALDARGAAA
ncbi:MAG: UDP-N-acetylmuramoyl-L-alanyl-D-glutamate--2,6-diaminopimelate ligase [Burkholderiaceae bacterium]